MIWFCFNLNHFAIIDMNLLHKVIKVFFKSMISESSFITSLCKNLQSIPPLLKVKMGRFSANFCRGDFLTLKSIFLKKTLNEIIWPRILLQKLPLLINAIWWGSFCNFLGQMILSITFLKKRTLVKLYHIKFFSYFKHSGNPINAE